MKILGFEISNPLFRNTKEVIQPTNGDRQNLPLVQRQKYLYNIDVQNWRYAHQQAIDIYRPRYQALMEVFSDASSDTTLAAKLQTRTLNIINTPFQLTKDDRADLEKTKELQGTWFLDVLRMIIESKYYGYSLIEFTFRSDGSVKKANLYPRENVIPQWDAVLPDIIGDAYISISQEIYQDSLVLVEADDLGLLLDCARYTIFKKHAVAHWSQYQELFGIPFRYANTNSTDKRVLDQIFSNLCEMGSAGYAIFPRGTEINFLEASKGDPYKVFQEAINVANQEISNRVLGSVQSTNQEGSFAREKVNYQISEDINYADLTMVENVINDKILPLLSKWGYTFEGLTFNFDPSWSLPLATNQLEVDRWLAENYELSEEYILETYGVPVMPKKPQAPSPKPVTALAVFGADKYDITCCDNHSEVNSDIRAELDLDFLESLFRNIWEGKIKAGQTDTRLLLDTANELWQAVRENSGSISYATDWASIQANSLYSFSAAKSFAQIKEMQNYIFKDGKKLPFSEFREFALTINAQYNRHWLRTEYDAVVRGTLMAEKWQSIQQDKDLFPFLRYKTAEDARVRVSHKALNGVVLAVDSPFWDSYYPPNGWNCRCTVEQLLESDAEPTDLDKAEKLAEMATAEEYWKKNTGKSAILESEGSYFDSLPRSISNLQAVKNYRMRSVANIYTKEEFLIPTPSAIGDSTQYIRTLGGVSTDTQGLIVSIPESLEMPLQYGTALSNLRAASEVWGSSAGDRVYIFYYEKDVVAITVEANTIIRMEVIAVSTAEKLRKGILIQKGY